ncbi:TolC family outer membrane protein [Luteimonas sp. MC1750]|uniref:TolC family outer membrane protein n=1 Tax=Luteimonas sp. MC1750 TaxID=2799326 RepID=UPI0018F08DE3|nr:TolC family outer membrane protein [Luteimonas sp. MC1750]MBJ6984885.1 TolC family outer membrane protein [Luteimonas sp. MC1750]QQO05569.1 TolC family outer membrane protein [Luteimonas sp. MC1750]
MTRRPLALALLLALLPAAASAEDLLQTYELARSSDTQLAISESSRDISREGRVQARAALLPQINGSASLSRSYAAGVDGDARRRSVGVDLSQTVFDLGAISNLRAQSDLDVAAGFDLDAANHELITRTSAAYFNVLVAIETLAASEAAEAALQKQFDFADKRLEVGLAPITDVHEARAQYDAARANTILSRNALEDAYQALAEITGRPVRTLRALPEDFQPQAPEGDGLGRWLATAMENNPSLRAAEYALSASEHSVNTARSGHLPRLTLGAGYDNGAAWGDLGPGGVGGTSTGEGHSVGLTLTVPIFAGGATQSQVRQALSRRDISEQQLEQSRRSLDRNTRNAYQTVVAGVSEIAARRQALVSARSAYEASQVGLEVGTRTVVDVLINQQNLFNAEREYALARYNFLQNRLLLAQAAGTLGIDDVQEINRLLTAEAATPDTQVTSGG